MRHLFVSEGTNTRLILFFCGWAMDAAPFAGLHRAGYDVVVLWDYRSFAIDWSFIAHYKEVCVVAWSFGVYAAAVTTVALENRITKRIAVNGTLYPVDRRRGIPESVFNATLESLSPRGLEKFYRRMAGGNEAFKKFALAIPERDIDELREELEVFAPCEFMRPQLATRWDLAIIGRDDAIIPAANQWRAWTGTPTLMCDAPHLPDFSKIIDRYIIDKERVGERFEVGLALYEHNAPVQQRLADALADALDSNGAGEHIAQRGSRVLEIGSGTGMLSRRLDQLCGHKAFLEMWDLAGKSPLPESPLRSFRRVDAELEMKHLPAASFDLIATASTVQWFNSPTRFMEECSRVCAPGGFVAVATYLHGNLSVISSLTGRTLPLLTERQWLGIIPDDFELLASCSYEDALEFSSAMDAFRHLKNTGVNSLGRDSAGENSITRAVRNFRPDLDGAFRLVYKPLYFILKKR